MKKDKNFRKFLFSLYKPVKISSIIMILSMIVSEVLKLFKQYMLKDIIDVPTKQGFKINDLQLYLILLVIFYIAELICSYISNITRTMSVYKKQTPYITEKLFNQISKKKYSFFTDNYSGKITTSINQIIDGTSQLNDRMTKGLISIATIMVTNLAMLFSINYFLFLVSFVFFAVIIVVRIIYFKKTYLLHAKKSQEAAREFDGILNDTIVNFTPIKIYNSTAKFGINLKNKRKESNNYILKAHKHEFSFGAIINVFYIMLFVLLTLYSLNQYKVGLMTIGDLVFFCNAMIALKSATTNFSWAYIETNDLLVRLKSGYELLYTGEDDSEDCDKPSIQVNSGELIFDNVTFGYSKKNVLQNFSITIQDKQKIGLIGESGSGKTTISNLIFKFFQPQEGKILVDGKDIQKYNNKSLYENITYIQQEAILLHSTILDNIKLVKPEASFEEVVEAAKKAQIHDFICKLDNKYNTIVGERGIKLSGGQRQRVALARIFLRNAKIVVFDEATSSLDGNTEFEVQKNINEYFKDQTVICIAHRLSTLENMDLIYVLKDGKIAEFGTPQEILPKYKSKKPQQLVNL